MAWSVHGVEYASHMACQNSGMLTHGAYVAVSRSMWKVMEPWSHVFKACWGLHLFFSYKLWLQLYLSLISAILLGELLSTGYLIRTACYNRSTGLHAHRHSHYIPILPLLMQRFPM